MASLCHQWLEPEVRCSCTAATYMRLPEGHAQRQPLLWLHTSLLSKPKASCSPYRPTSTQQAGAHVPRGNHRSHPLGCQCRMRLSAEIKSGAHPRGFLRASKSMVSLDLQQNYPQHHKEAGKCHLVLQVES